MIATVVCNICISISRGLRQQLGLGDYIQGRRSEGMAWTWTDCRH